MPAEPRVAIPPLIKKLIPSHHSLNFELIFTLTEEWRIINQKELLESFELMVKYHQVKKIEGLK
jgi:hypothetical protein